MIKILTIKADEAIYCFTGEYYFGQPGISDFEKALLQKHIEPMLINKNDIKNPENSTVWVAEIRFINKQRMESKIQYMVIPTNLNKKFRSRYEEVKLENKR